LEGDGSPVIDFVGDVSNGPLQEASTASSLSDASSLGAASDVAKAKAEVSVDPRELVWRYDFGASSVTVSLIRQLESLGYFDEGSAREPGDWTVPEPNPNEAIVFKEFFAVGLRMLPHPAFTEILLKFWVQLHQLTPEHYCSDVEVFLGGAELRWEPSSDGFAKCYELHY
jgi:hypothetical protein